MITGIEIKKNCKLFDLIKLNDSYKVDLVMVISGIKPNISFENINNKDIGVIKNIAETLGFYFKIIEYDNYKKLILGHNKKEIDELFSLEKKIFGKNEVEENWHKRYGELMGYPKCCLCPKLEKNTKIRNPVGFHFYQHNPWKKEGCFFLDNVYHYPCSSKCKETISLGKKKLLIKKEILQGIQREAVEAEKVYVLHFAQNIYCVFSGDKKKNGYEVKKILRVLNDPYRENTDLDIEFGEQSQFISKIKIGTLLKINDKQISIINHNIELIYDKQDVSDGCLIEFN